MRLQERLLYRNIVCDPNGSELFYYTERYHKNRLYEYGGIVQSRFYAYNYRIIK